MKIFNSKFKNIGYFIYRIIKPIIDPIKFFQGIYGYFWFFRDIIRYKLQNRKVKIIGMNLFPILDEKISFTPFDAHYFYQQLWVFENVLKNKPVNHIDIGSTYQMSGYLSKITKTTFVDLRPIDTKLRNLEIKRGNILNLPFENNSIKSLSCLHVAEHIGLGRYGDDIDLNGTKKACKELDRILAFNGKLYFSLPVGKNRICFNSHRIHSPETILSYFCNLELVSFSVVDDEGNFKEEINCKDFQDLNYGCGMFVFTKKN